MEISVLKPLGLRKLSHSSEMQNAVSIHREGLKGQASNDTNYTSLIIVDLETKSGFYTIVR